MAHIVDLKEPYAYNTSEAPASGFLATLAAAQGCNLLMLIDKIVKNHDVSDTTARLALDLLRRINRPSVVITPSVNDDPKSFVAKMLITAKDIVENGKGEDSPLFVSAKRFTDCLRAYREENESSASLENAWQDFSLHYYRERLYRFLAR